MNTAVANSETAILSRAIEPESSTLSPEAARSILQITLSEADCRRLDELAAKTREDSLTPDERVELDNYRSVGRLLELMQSKARLSLKKAPGHA